jgi:hypothetical protein
MGDKEASKTAKNVHVGWLEVGETILRKGWGLQQQGRKNKRDKAPDVVEWDVCVCVGCVCACGLLRTTQQAGRAGARRGKAGQDKRA